MTAKKMNEEFDLDGLDAAMAEEAPNNTAPKPTAKKKVAPKKRTAPKKAAAPKKKVCKKVWIMIDEVKDMGNFETVGHNGDIIQIKRGVPVEVDEKYVHALELAVGTNEVVGKDPATGEKITETRSFAAIPWRLVPPPKEA